MLNKWVALLHARGSIVFTMADDISPKPHVLLREELHALFVLNDHEY